MLTERIGSYPGSAEVATSPKEAFSNLTREQWQRVVHRVNDKLARFQAWWCAAPDSPFETWDDAISHVVHTHLTARLSYPGVDNEYINPVLGYSASLRRKGELEPAENGILPPKVYKAGLALSALGVGMLVGARVAPELGHTVHALLDHHYPHHNFDLGVPAAEAGQEIHSYLPLLMNGFKEASIHILRGSIILNEDPGYLRRNIHTWIFEVDAEGEIDKVCQETSMIPGYEFCEDVFYTNPVTGEREEVLPWLRVSSYIRHGQRCAWAKVTFLDQDDNEVVWRGKGSWCGTDTTPDPRVTPTTEGSATPAVNLTRIPKSRRLTPVPVPPFPTMVPETD